MMYGPDSPAAGSSDLSLPASLCPACPPRFHLSPQGSFLEAVSLFSRCPSCSWCLFTHSGPSFFGGVFSTRVISLLDGHVVSASRDWAPCVFPVHAPLTPEFLMGLFSVWLFSDGWLFSGRLLSPGRPAPALPAAPRCHALQPWLLSAPGGRAASPLLSACLCLRPVLGAL